MNPPSHPAVLVIGYGNELRSDDGLGPRVARAIEQLELPGVRVIRCHQLTPELADPISASDAVIFIDAAVEGTLQVRPLLAAASGQILGHVMEPRGLLQLARELFGRCPPAWWITIPAGELGFGDQLSPKGQAGFTAALEAFKQLWPTVRSET